MANEALAAPGVTQLFAVSLQKNEKKLADQVLLTHPTLEFLKANAKSQTGRGLVIPVRAAQVTGTAYASTNSGDFSYAVSNDIIGSAIFDWSKEILTPYRVEHMVILQNSGPEAIVNLVEEYVTGAMYSHQKFIVDALWKEAPGAGELTSFPQLVRATDTLSTTVAQPIGQIRGGNPVANITKAALTSNVVTLTLGATDFIVGDSVVVALAPADAIYDGTHTLTGVTATTVTYAVTHANVAEATVVGTATCSDIKEWWVSTVITSDHATEDILKAHRRLFNGIYQLSRKRPTNVSEGFDNYEDLEAFLQDKGRYNLSTDTKAELRFRELVFDGIVVRQDPDLPSTETYAFHAPALRFGFLAGEFMKTYPAQPILGTLDEVVPIASTLSIGTNERRAHGRMTRV